MKTGPLHILGVNRDIGASRMNWWEIHRRSYWWEIHRRSYWWKIHRRSHWWGIHRRGYGWKIHRRSHLLEIHRTSHWWEIQKRANGDQITNCQWFLNGFLWPIGWAENGQFRFYLLSHPEVVVIHKKKIFLIKKFFEKSFPL